MLSSLNVNNRLWTTPRFAYRLIIGVSIFWMLFSIHAFFGSKNDYVMGYSYCSIEKGSYAWFITFYGIIINYLLPPTLMVTFGLLTIINVQRTHRRIRDTTSRRTMQRKDQHLLRMLLFQVLVSVIFTVPMTVIQVETTLLFLYRLIKRFFSIL